MWRSGLGRGLDRGGVTPTSETVGVTPHMELVIAAGPLGATESLSIYIFGGVLPFSRFALASVQTHQSV